MQKTTKSKSYLVILLSTILVSLLLNAAHASSSTGTGNHAHSNSFTLLPFDTSLTADLEFSGEVVDGAHWRDAMGENVLVMSQSGSIPSTSGDCLTDDGCEDAEVYAYHYIRDDEGNNTLLWKIIDYERDCPFDLYAGFIPDSLSITDLDSDGVAESTFLYKLVCRSDVSPAGLKLIMHEGQQKYAIRGSTRLPHNLGGGEMRLGWELKEAGNPFKAFAIEQWDLFVREFNE